MKTFTSVSLSLLLGAFLLSFTSCDRGEALGKNDQSTSDFNVNEVRAVASGTPANTSTTYCSEKIVNLCSSTGSMGKLDIKRGSDDRIYFTYTGQADWYLAQVSLYAGPLGSIPMYLADFPNKKTFSYPFSTQEFSFAVAHLPESFSVVAHAILVKKLNGRIVATKACYADGCSGLNLDICTRIHATAAHVCGHGGSGGDRCETDLDGATYLNYTSSSCSISAIAVEPDNLCSYTISSFFAIDPANPNSVTWRVASVTVAGNTYTEAEAKAVGNSPDNNNGAADSKYAFMRVATLKLSNTDYTTSPSLSPAVTTIENWLQTTGKLTTTNLPNGNAAVRSAAELINTWIDTHNCAVEE
ncbi:MAG: hypothetical protein ACJ75B_01375 [Flavisolibacter sp.]